MVDVPENYLEEAYDDYVQRIEMRSEKRASHIMVDLINYESKDAALKIITSPKDELNSGKDFIDVVLEYSEDIISKELSVTIPKIGDKKKLIDLSFRNAKHMLLDHQKRKINTIDRQDNKRILEQLQKDLNLLGRPRHIECFDNSIIHGEISNLNFSAT